MDSGGIPFFHQLGLAQTGLTEPQVLDHPWMQGHAGRTVLGDEVKKRLAGFASMNRLKKMTLQVTGWLSCSASDS